MRTETFRKLLIRTPFHPFRIHLSDGARFEVRHPDFLLLSEDRLVLTVTSQLPTGEIVSLIDPLHVTHAVLIESQGTPTAAT